MFCSLIVIVIGEAWIDDEEGKGRAVWLAREQGTIMAPHRHGRALYLVPMTDQIDARIKEHVGDPVMVDCHDMRVTDNIDGGRPMLEFAVNKVRRGLPWSL